MTQRFNKFAERHGVAATVLSEWEPVDVSHLAPSDREIFKRRSKAIKLYDDGEPIDRIECRTGVSKTELYRILDRSMTPDPTGRPYGFLACVPHYRLTPHPGGVFTQFLETHPKIQEMLDGWATGKIPINQAKSRGRGTLRIWEAFRGLCKTSGIDTVQDYPFCNQDQGKESIRVYCKRLRHSDFVTWAKVEYGSSAARLAGQAMRQKPDYSDLRPYELIQFDAHRIDCILNIRFEDERGDIQDLPLSRLWLLVALDVSSRAVLGYTLSYGTNYSVDDVVACLGSVFVPWKPRNLPSEDISYLPGAGLPSGAIPECAWRAFDTIRMDNHWSHISTFVQKKIIETGANEVILNRPRTPRANAILERFFLTFEKQTGHRFPNTTGSNPKDPRRHNPEKAAKVLGMDDEDMWIIADLALANYNASPHTSLNNRTPLEFLRYRLQRDDDLIRHIPFTSEEALPLYWRQFKVTIHGDPANGHLPYVIFKGARYFSDSLRCRSDLIGEKAMLWVNIVTDIRQVRLFLTDGSSMGYLLVESRWREMAHTLRTRKAINKLCRETPSPIDSSAPMSSYVNNLAKLAPKSRPALNLLLKACRDAAASEEFLGEALGRQPKSRPVSRDKSWVTIDKVF